MVNARVSTREAAELLGLPVQTLRIGLQRGKFDEFGEAIETSPGRYTYYINRYRLDLYLGQANGVTA